MCMCMCRIKDGKTGPWQTGNTEELLDWLVKAWPDQAPEKLDMGKSCIRFKKIDDIPHALLGELASKMSVEEWIDLHEAQFKRG